ncbi:MAG: hypothetical protein ACXVCP_00320 [Bdellovibrio sp.]
MSFSRWSNSNGAYKHGLRGHPLYVVWASMKRRCLTPKNYGYKNYGGRGITICDSWMNDFKSFYDWSLSSGYESGLELDRIDVNGNYSPENCRFVTRSVQANNKRSNILYTENGETKTLKQWCEVKGLEYTKIRGRIGQGYSPKDAIYGIFRPRKKRESKEAAR